MDDLASLRVIERGSATAGTGGAPAAVLFVHGTAADASSWSGQLAGLPAGWLGVAYERRSSVRTVAGQVDDAARVVEARAGGPVVACGASFGGVVVLELARTRPELVRGAVVCEPPLAAGEYLPSMPAGFGCEFDRVVAQSGGEAAAERFLRLVMGDAAYDRLPEAMRRRMCARWEQIRADSIALVRHGASYARIAEVAPPVLLVGGARSTPYFGLTLDALERALPDVRRQTVRGAGHAVHMEAVEAFNRLLFDFGAEVAGAARQAL